MTRRPRYADVAATLALVLALGGTTAYAVQTLPKNSVGKQQLKKDAITSKKIKNGKIKGEDLANDTLTGAKLAPSSVGLSDLAASSVNGSKVVDKSLSLDDLAGGVGTSSVSYTDLAAGSCQPVVVTVAGATAAQFAVLGLTSGTADGVSFAPARAGAGVVTSRLCNVSAAPVSGTLVVKALTLG